MAKGKQDSDRLIRETLSSLGLQPDAVLGRFPHQLSGGQRQRIMIARAILPSPKVIIADEPVSMVDASLRALILENMLHLKRDLGISFLYITHDLSTAYQISDDIYVLYLGGVAEHGDVARVIENPHLSWTRSLSRGVTRLSHRRGGGRPESGRRAHFRTARRTMSRTSGPREPVAPGPGAARRG